MRGSSPQLSAMRCGASPLTTSVPRPEPHTPRAPATIFLSAWNQVIFGPGTSPTSTPDARGTGQVTTLRAGGPQRADAGRRALHPCSPRAWPAVMLAASLASGHGDEIAARALE